MFCVSGKCDEKNSSIQVENFQTTKGSYFVARSVNLTEISSINDLKSYSIYACN